jgi:hypothetical protein
MAAKPMPAAAIAACLAMFNMLSFFLLRKSVLLSRCLFVQRRSAGLSALRQIASEVQMTHGMPLFSRPHGYLHRGLVASHRELQDATGTDASARLNEPPIDTGRRGRKRFLQAPFERDAVGGAHRHRSTPAG